MKCEITKNTNMPPNMPTIIGIIRKHLPAVMLDILIQTLHAQYCLLTTGRKLKHLVKLGLGTPVNLPCPPLLLCLCLSLFLSTNCCWFCFLDKDGHSFLLLCITAVETIIILPTTHTAALLWETEPSPYTHPTVRRNHKLLPFCCVRLHEP